VGVDNLDTISRLQ